jgi:hypothetical protein
MLELLTNQTFLQIASITVVVVLGLIALRVQSHRKLLSYELITNEQLLGGHAKELGDVKIMYKGAEVTDAHLVVVKIINNGSVPIKPQDFVRNPSLAFDEDSNDINKLLDFGVSEKNPSDLDVSLLENEPLTIELQPTLLNPRDWLKIQALIRDFEGKISTAGRIVGVKRFGKLYPPLLRPSLVSLLGIALLLMGAPFAAAHPGDEAAIIPFGVGLLLVVTGGAMLLERIKLQMRDWRAEKR